MKRVAVGIAWLMAALFWVGAAQASILSELQPRDIGVETPRNALVIGNSNYDNITSLPNPANDADAVARALSNVGFHVYRAVDVDRVSMQDAIGQFLNAVTPGSEALIYYAGHGVELEGQNFLLPTDIRKLDPSQQYSLRTDGVSLSLLLEDLQARQPRVSLVVLDACRNNPFDRAGTRSLGGQAGLGRVEPPQGTIVIYAAAAGEMALDSLGAQDTDPNGLFTRNFLRLIEQPGLEIRPMVQELKERVYEAALDKAQHTQRPSYYDGLIGKFYFVPLSDRPAVDPCVLAVAPKLSRDELLFADPAAGIALCSEAARNDPNSTLYRDLLAVAEEQRAAQKALLSDNPLYSNAYLSLYPAGQFSADVRTHVASLGPNAPVEPAPTPAPDVEVAVVPPEPLPEVDVAALARDVQAELNRVGCDAGSPDGVWGRNSERALERFSKEAGLEVAALDPTPELLLQLRDVTDRVCPLTCSVKQIEQGGVCVAKTCPAGQQLSSKGTCYTPKAAPAPKRAERPKPAAGCFAFNGQTFCE